MRFLLLASLFLFASCGSGSQQEHSVAIDPSWYPLNLMGRENQLRGFTTELLQEIATLKKINITTVRENWDSLIAHLQQKKYDAILSSLQPYLFYEKQYDFSEPFLLIGPVLVLPFTSNLTSLDQLGGKEIAIIEGSKDALILEKYSSIIIRTYGTIPEIFQAIVSGSVEGALVDVLPAQAYVQDLYHGEVKIVGVPLTNNGLRMVVLHDQQNDFLKAFDDALRELKKNGKYAALVRKWRL